MLKKLRIANARRRARQRDVAFGKRDLRHKRQVNFEFLVRANPCSCRFIVEDNEEYTQTFTFGIILEIGDPRRIWTALYTCSYMYDTVQTRLDVDN